MVVVRELLRRAQDADLKLTVKDDRLLARGPKRAQAVAAEILQNAETVMEWIVPSPAELFSIARAFSFPSKLRGVKVAATEAAWSAMLRRSSRELRCELYDWFEQLERELQAEEAV